MFSPADSPPPQKKIEHIIFTFCFVISVTCALIRNGKYRCTENWTFIPLNVCLNTKMIFTWAYCRDLWDFLVSL